MWKQNNTSCNFHKTIFMRPLWKCFSHFFLTKLSLPATSLFPFVRNTEQLRNDSKALTTLQTIIFNLQHHNSKLLCLVSVKDITYVCTRRCIDYSTIITYDFVLRIYFMLLSKYTYWLVNGNKFSWNLLSFIRWEIDVKLFHTWKLFTEEICFSSSFHRRPYISIMEWFWIQLINRRKSLRIRL